MPPTILLLTHRHRPDSDTIPARTQLVQELQAALEKRRQQLQSDASRYRRLLATKPQQLATAIKEAERIAQQGLRSLQVRAQLQLGLLADRLARKLKDAHDFAVNKHQQHLAEAEQRQQIRADYISQAIEERDRDVTTNRERVEQHLHPLTVTVDQSAIHPLHISPPPLPPPCHEQIAKVGPLSMPQAQAELLHQLRQSPISQERKVLYSDGFMVRAGTKECAMAFGVADISTTAPHSIPGRADGQASSGKAELMGLLAAIVSMPPGQDILVRLDNEGVVTSYQDLVVDRHTTLPRKRQRATHAGLWAVLASVVAEREGRTEVEWVRGHSGDQGNETADAIATKAVEQDTTPWQADLSTQDDITFIASCHGQQLESDFRQFLKQQTTIRRHQTWTAQNRVKRAISDLDDVEWRSALSIIHAKRPVHTFFSSRGDTTRRTQHIKKLHGMLPTLTVMQARYPDMYEDALCCRCGDAQEDNNHVWTCPNSVNQQRQIWEEAVATIPKWGRAAITRANEEATKRIVSNKPAHPTLSPREHFNGISHRTRLCGHHCTLHSTTWQQ
ncbi:hypothetical protein EMPS_07090 [Entomortierella parvispora]|uniref:RNase H type-1 domain-containing protein n=1 Tax=Entomortierella parvispora TaxID=205924 RepID=A0A9P3HE84_9FUNG|nr:hypothetical protein EMPS_07090 [Entomortierella parvispora]